MADKGNVYYCRWEKNQEGNYVGWEEKYPSRRAEATTPRDLMSALGELVGEYHNDHEACLQFDPPLTAGEDRSELFKDQIVSLSWNSSFRFTPSAKTAFAGGKCQECQRGIGPRTAAPLIVDDFGGGTEGASSWPTIMGGHLIIVSEAFLTLLAPDERAAFDTRPVEWNPKRRLKFFEIIPRAFFPEVAIKGLSGSGWRCTLCGRKHYSHGEALGWGPSVICRTSLTSPASPLFFIGDELDYRPCVSRKRWEALRGRSGARKLTSNPLAIVDEKQCDGDPWVPTLAQLAEFHRGYGSALKYIRPNLPDGPLVPQF